MPLKPIDEVFESWFDLPAGPGGKVYRVPECDAKTGLFCQRMITAAYAIQNGQPIPEDETPLQLVFEGKDEVDLQERLLSKAVREEMWADGLGASKISFCTQVVMFWHGLGRETAELYWNAGGRPVDFRPPANRAGRRGAAKSTASTNTAAAPTTRKRASGSTTTSRAARPTR